MGNLKTLLFVLLSLIVLGTCICAAQSEPAVVIGHKDYIDSKILGERRPLMVQMPEVPQGIKVPVLVMLDAEFSFQQAATIAKHLTSAGRLPPMAIVGVVNTNRGRDMNPGFEGNELASNDPSARFLDFLCDELVPYLEQKYPVSGYRTIVGGSQSGIFLMYALAKRPETFQAHVIMSPAAGDDRFQVHIARALSKPGFGPHFLFVSMGDEEADIALGATRLTKTIEENAQPSLTFHYEYFPGETHLSGGFKAMYRALELLGAADPIDPNGAARYLTEKQRRERAWTRRFGSSFMPPNVLGAPTLSVSRPLLDCLGESRRAELPALWASLRGQYAPYFRFEPLDLKNLLTYLEASGRKDDAAALRGLPDFPPAAKGDALNNYGSTVDLKAGLAAHIVMDGGLQDLAAPGAQFKIQGAVPTTDRHGEENKAYTFDGKASFISETGNAALQASGSLTVSTWIRPRVPTAYAGWISQPRGAGWGSKWRVGFGASPESQWGPTVLVARWTDYWTNGNGIPANKWTHVVCVFDQTLGTLRLYQDGKLVKEFYGLPNWAASTGPLLIGVQRDDGIYYNGDVGEIRIYNRTLNDAEVAKLYQTE